jgi:large subunit ribosomal protein L29
MKTEQIREMTTEDIIDEIRTHERTLMGLRMGNAIGTVDNPLELRSERRAVARMKTVLRERELEIR